MRRKFSLYYYLAGAGIEHVLDVSVSRRCPYGWVFIKWLSIEEQMLMHCDNCM